jgi:hypothetical protein
VLKLRRFKQIQPVNLAHSECTSFEGNVRTPFSWVATGQAQAKMHRTKKAANLRPGEHMKKTLLATMLIAVAGPPLVLAEKADKSIPRSDRISNPRSFKFSQKYDQFQDITLYLVRSGLNSGIRRCRRSSV